jgi:ectoine hydroxylase-related dioxygenase (phytanoyl-CoA dioxygenase family)
VEILNQECLENYETEGCLSLESAVGPSGLAQLKDFCDFLFRCRGVDLSDDGEDFDSLNNKFLCWIRAAKDESEAFKERVAFYKQAEMWASQLLKLEAEDIKFRLRVFYKHPKSYSPVDWHQDEAFYQRFSQAKPEGYTSLNMWVALDDATLRNGCLKYVPGSHKEGLLPHKIVGSMHFEGILEGEQRENSEQDGTTLYIEDYQDDRAIYAPLKAGGVNIHHCLTVHGSDRNTDNSPRGALVLIFQKKTNCSGTLNLVTH